MNLFALSSLAVAVVSIWFGISIYRENPSSHIGKQWFHFMLACTVWSTGLYGITSTHNADTALVWQYILDFGAIFIPFLYLRFVLALLNLKKPVIETIVAFGTAILLVLSVTPFYKVGVVMSQFGFYWIQYGPLYIIFPIFFIAVSGFAVSLIIQKYLQNKGNSFIQGQNRNHIIAVLIGFGGGLTDFLPRFFNIYPFGNYFIILYVVFMGYAVIRYRFFDIKIVSSQFFASALVLAALFNLFNALSLVSWLIYFGLFVLVGIFSLLLVKSVYKEVEQRELIEQQKKALEVVNKQQITLIHFISHEVKGFLTKDIVAFSTLVDGDFGILPDKAEGLAKEALKQSRDGATSIINILQAANLKKGTVSYHKKSFDFAELVKNTFSKFTDTAQKKGLIYTLSIDEKMSPYTIVGDTEQIGEHVLRNLIENAINYTPKGNILVSLTKNTKKDIVFSIKDSGVGITDEDKKVLFTEGGNGKNSIKVNVHSTGYGLYIAKKIIDAHNGTIRAESDGEGKGSIFIIELPNKS